MRELYVIKIGGNIIDDPGKLEGFLQDLASLPGYKILIHGGGKIATQLSEDLGIRSRMVEGRRVTDAESLKVVTMVYAGLINKNIVAALQAVDCNAIGLTGADGNIIRASKRPVRLMSGGEEVDFGFVGDLANDSVNVQAVTALLDSGFVPVFSAITHDGNGQLLNTNADTISSVIAVSMSAEFQVSLVYCFEKNGVLSDITDDKSVIREIDPSRYKTLREENIIFEGMIPKIDNAFDAINRGVHEVFIGNAASLTDLGNKNFGTRLTQNGQDV